MRQYSPSLAAAWIAFQLTPVIADQAISPPELADLPAMARAAKDQFAPITKAEVLSQQVAVEAALRRLDRYLQASGPNGEGWRRYLRLNELQAEMQNGLNANPAIHGDIGYQFISGAPGLELAPFASMGASLRAYADVLAAYQNAEARQQYQQQLDALASELDAAVENPEEVDRDKLGATLGAIAASGQAGELVAAVRYYFARPNLHVQVSRQIVTGGIEEDIDEYTPIRDVILGTQMYGRGRTRGQVTAALVPSDEQATIELTLRGSTASKNVGHNGPATIFSTANTSLLSRKRLFIDDLGFTSLAAQARCCTNSHIGGVSVCGGRLVQRIANKRVYASKSTGEAISARHAEVRLENRMNTRAGGLLADVNDNYDRQFRNPLMRRGAFPAMFQFSTSPDWLMVVGLQARTSELGATSPPPEAASDAQLAIRLHESLLENMAAGTMAGETVYDEDFKRLMRNVHGKDLDEEELKVLLRNLGNGTEPYEDFASLLQDREEQPISPEEFAALRDAIQQKQLTQAQVDLFILPLSKTPLTLPQVNAMLHDLPEESQGSLTFTPTHPIAVGFRDGTFTITLRSTAHSSRTGVERRLPMNISATYQVEHRGGEVVATRQGEIEVNPPGFQPGDRLDIQQTAARRTLRTRFENIFKPEFTSTGLTLRGRGKKLGELPWAQIVLENGWLATGWRPADATAMLTTVD